MILYKYRGNTDFTYKIFKDQEVWLSNASGLNDPFECSLQEIAKEWVEDKVKKGRQAQFIGFLVQVENCIKNNENFFGMTQQQVKTIRNTFKSKLNFDKKYQMYKELIKRKTGHYPTDMAVTIRQFDKQLNDVGIFSLSESDENQLMWAHYAEESKGIAIGFAIEEKTKLADTKHCLKVSYSDILPAFVGEGFISETSFYMDELGQFYPEQKISFNDPTFKLAITTKATCWAYEKEWRYIEEKPGIYCLPGKIKEIIFGLRCTPESRKIYKSLVEKYILNPVSFFEIQKMPNSNSIIKVALKNN